MLPPTETFTPGPTVTPTFESLPSNTPPPDLESSFGRLRVIHALRGDTAPAVDVLIDDVSIGRDLQLGEYTAYQRIFNSVVRVTILPAQGSGDPNQARNPIISELINVPTGRSLAVVLAASIEPLGPNPFNAAPRLITVQEDVTPLATGQSRLAILQANSLLLRSNIVTSTISRMLARNLDFNQVVGPFDIPAESYPLTLFDADAPEQTIMTLPPLPLQSQVNYLLVLLPATLANNEPVAPTDYILVPGSTNLAPSDLGVRFVNAATAAGSLQISVDGRSQISQLNVGEVALTSPIARLGSNIVIGRASGGQAYSNRLVPEAGIETDRIAMIVDAPGGRVDLAIFPQNPRPSSLRASFRLIHGLAGTNPLDLQVRPINPTASTELFGAPANQQDLTAWSTLVQGIAYGTASDYVQRAPNAFDVRLVLSGTQSVQAQIDNVQFLPGGVYDFMALPSDRPGVIRLVMLEPSVQVSILGIDPFDPALVQEQVEIALTASAPAVVSSPTPLLTATPTISPVPTNTPRPSSTPAAPLPGVRILPAPPDTVSGSMVLLASGLIPGERYTISLAGGPENISGRVESDGSLALTINLPPSIAPGPQILRLCVDCRPNGAQQEIFAVFNVADSSLTPTATVQP